MTSIASYLQTSAVANVENALAAAKSHESFNALISLTEDRALARAKEIDGFTEKGRLAGVPFVVKDNFLVFGSPTTAGSKILENYETPIQATAIERLEAEGAICIGKANLDAFGHGSSTENSAYGVTKNTFDETRVAGGSSGGSAVVTALDIVPFALGTDTGGSIRQPAGFNGVIGIKPTYGLVSRFGVVAMANGTDTVGCFASTAEDAAIVLAIMAGRDEDDPTTLPNAVMDAPQRLTKQKIGVISELMTDSVDDEVKQAVLQYIEKLRADGHDVEEISMPIIRYSLAMYYIIVSAEISSNLARYDGIRYGKREEANSLTEIYEKSREKGFMFENKRRILMGSYVLSSGYFDAYYLKAQKARTLLIEAFDKLFKTYDVLISPVSPTPAFKIGQNTADPVKMYLEDAMTVPASLAGLPAVSVPAGATKAGLPIGVQLIGPARSDSMLLAVAGNTKENI